MKQRQELKLMVRQRLSRNWKGRWIVWPLFNWLLDKIEFHTRERDTFHFEMTRIFPAFRRYLHELGTRWAARGWLSDPEQIFFLRLDEMESMVKAPEPMGTVAAQRRQEYEANKQRTWPDALRGGQEIYARGADQSASGDGLLAGVPGSPGVVSGRARVICGPEEFHRLEPGEILVAPITNPVWTPLFAIAGGVITEVGGILSHGAIVAREYGIPAVMSIPHATQRVPDGQMLTVDGNRGWVTLDQAGEL
jgi:pyruvate,water dikinase